MYLSAQSIRKLQQNLEKQGNFLFYPFVERELFNGMTYGLGPAGYDVRVEFDDKGTVDFVTLKPYDCILASTIEKMYIPNDLVVEVKDKSTWARRFVTVQNTVAEPGWTGFLTLEIINHSKVPVTIVRGSPIAQIMFAKLDEPSEMSYDKLYGKYQNQRRGPVGPIDQI